MARWLVHVSDWGVLSTRGPDGNPIGGVVSTSDGMQPSGRLLFYLTVMDELAQNLQEHPVVSLTLTEAQQLPAGCGSTDVEDPTCAKVTVLGRMQLVPSAQQEVARRMLFDRHPAMADWPVGHQFQLYELHVEELHLLDWYGGMHVIGREEYFAALAASGQQPGTMSPTVAPARAAHAA